MAYFKSLTGAVSYDNYVESVISGNVQPQYVGINALKNSDVLTAVSIISGDVARFPIIKKDFEGNIIPDEDINYLLNVRSTANATARAWKFAMTVNTILTGNSYSRIIRDPINGKPLQYIFYRPSETVVEENEKHELFYTFTDSITEKEIKCQAEDVIHWKFFSHDTITGRSPLLSLREEISLQESGVDTLTRFFKSGFSSGILKMKGSQLGRQARKKAREDFDYSREGATGGSPIVLDDTMDYTALQIDTNVLQLINSNNYSTAQIAKCLRIPAYKLAVNSPNQSVKQLNEDYIKNDLPYYFDAITSEIALKCFIDSDRKKFQLIFDTRSVTGLSVEDVVRLYNNGIYNGDQSLSELGKAKSGDPNMARRKASLNYVWADKIEEYQDNQSLKNDLKGGDENSGKD